MKGCDPQVKIPEKESKINGNLNRMLQLTKKVVKPGKNGNTITLKLESGNGITETAPKMEYRIKY